MSDTLTESPASPREDSLLDPAVYRRSAEACRARGDELGALANRLALEALALRNTDLPGAVERVIVLATGYFMKGDDDFATHWYRLALRLDPACAIAYLNLADIADRRGDAAGAQCLRDRAFGLQRVFVEQGGGPGATRVLVLYSGRLGGNVPVEILLPGGEVTRIKYALDCADACEDALLPAFDVVFNAVGDGDVAQALAERLERFAAGCRRPILNPAPAVALTQRHRLAALLAGIDDVIVPVCCRCESPATVSDASSVALAGVGLGFPLLVRPVGSHGGEDLVLCAHSVELGDCLATLASPFYVTQFHDTRASDGVWRKYRVIYVDRAPYPYHLALSDHWKVHYFSAQMAVPAKMQEERSFLADARAVLGERAYAAIAAIGAALDLDYAGIDFAIAPDGRVCVFEANATMRVHFEREDGPFAYKNAGVRAIVRAFSAMLARRQQSGVGY